MTISVTTIAHNVLRKADMSTMSKRFSKGEELLLRSFRNEVPLKTSILFYCNAFIVSALPIWLFWRIHGMDFLESILLYVTVTLISTSLLSIAYRNTKYVLKYKTAVKYDLKKISKRRKEEKILWERSEAANYEATTFSIFYNNALFLALVIFLSFYLLRSFSLWYNYVFSVGGSSALLALLSRRTQNL